MSNSQLDQLVKGAVCPPPRSTPLHFPHPPLTDTAQPPPNISPTTIAEKARRTTPHSITAPVPPSPLDALPSSPPQIYLNLLILEASLRLQYLTLRARLRLHLLLLFTLLAWLALFTYALFLRPREDGRGVGGSIYWMVESGEKLAWCGGVVTLGLFWGTGMYDRGVRWPRRWVGTTNRGLRGFNMKVVVVRGGFGEELLGWIGLILDPAGWWRGRRVDFQLLPRDLEAAHNTSGKEHGNKLPRQQFIDEDLAPAGDALKLLLLPKPFSPAFRDGWETFRLEYWERENARRAALRRAVRQRAREIARREGGWAWWTGSWRGKKSLLLHAECSEKRRKPMVEKEKYLAAPSSLRAESTHSRSGSVSRSSSRSSTTGTPTRDGIGEAAKHHRRGSSSHSGTAARRKKGAAVGQGSRLSATETVLQDSGGGRDGLEPLTRRDESPAPVKQVEGMKEDDIRD